MGIYGNKPKDGGIMDVIRCDEPSYLIWKWHPAGVQQGEGRRENSIRWGSSLRVKDGEVAVFVYTRKDGISQEYIEGPCDNILNTSNLPILASIIGLAYDGNTPFQAEVYFINLARIVQVKFGVPYFDVFDPRFSDYGVPVAVRGAISFKISDYREFIKLHRLQNLNLEDFKLEVRDAVVRYVKDSVINAPGANDIPVVQIESKISLINDTIEFDVGERLRESFGVTVSGVDINALEIDKSSEGYAHLMAVTKEVEMATTTAKKEAAVKNIHDMQRIEAENYSETLRIQREEGQYATRKHTQTGNFAAYQVEAQTQVGIAGAEALGQMGINGAGGVNIGNGDGTGFNPAAMMVGMSLGGAIGQNISSTMNGVMSQMNMGIPVPPPIPSDVYHIVIDGQSQGPYNKNALKKMMLNGDIDENSLVWKPGMTDWVSIEAVADLSGIMGEKYNK